MYVVKHFLTFPLPLLKRQQSLIGLSPLLLKTEEINNDDYVFHFNCNNYNVIINILDDNITIKSPLKVSCDCDSFKFEFAHNLFKNNLIYNPYDIIAKELLEIPPKNKYPHISGCKHVISSLNFLMSNLSNIKRNLPHYGTQKKKI